MIVESPDYPPPTSARMAPQAPDFRTYVLDSVSQGVAPAQLSQAADPRTISTPSTRAAADTQSPGVVMAAEVKESVPPPRRGEIPEPGKTKRVSKFKAERT